MDGCSPVVGRTSSYLDGHFGFDCQPMGEETGTLPLCFGANMHAYKWNNMQVAW
jgi:hypothetical protein